MKEEERGGKTEKENNARRETLPSFVRGGSPDRATAPSFVLGVAAIVSWPSPFFTVLRDEFGEGRRSAWLRPPPFWVGLCRRNFNPDRAGGRGRWRTGKRMVSGCCRRFRFGTACIIWGRNRSLWLRYGGDECPHVLGLILAQSADNEEYPLGFLVRIVLV